MEVRGIDVTLEVAATASPASLVGIELFSELGIQESNSAEERTTKGSAQVRQLSTASALKSYSVDGTFVADTAGLAILQAASKASDPKVFARITASGQTYTGWWLVENFSVRGGSQGVATGTVSLQNSTTPVIA